ncbi:hydrogenase assembly protein HypC [Clostridia bacterium]|nr:hydrogenase assembly protein HypC [Clostridia bacterium]
MCIAVPGKVLSVNENRAKVDFNGNIVDVMSVVAVEPGDYVLVHAGCAIEVVESGLAEELNAIFRELDAM